MHLYSAQFQAKKQRPDESWADLADGLKLLADRALPELQEEAQEKLSLHHFLGEVTNQQVVSAVCQRRPKTLDDAVAHTLELELYLKTKSAVVAGITEEQAEMAAMRMSQDLVMEVLQSLVERMDRLEASAICQGTNKEPNKKQTARLRGPIVCYKCRQEGHFARECAAGR